MKIADMKVICSPANLVKLLNLSYSLFLNSPPYQISYLMLLLLPSNLYQTCFTFC